MSNHNIIVFSYAPAKEFAHDVQAITLKCELIEDSAGGDAAVAREMERSADDRVIDKFLCKKTQEARAAKATWFAENLAYHYRNQAGTPAVVTIEWAQ